MKNFKVIICFLATSFAFAQEPITKEMGEITSVKTFDKISVELIKANENKVVLTGTDNDYAELINNNGELKIKMSAKKLLKGDKVHAKVYHTSNIYEIIATEGTKVTSSDAFKLVDLNLSAKEGAEIKLDIDVKKVNANVNSGGKITLEGSADNQDYLANSGGVIKANNLKSSQCNVTANAGGEAFVTATELVDAKVRAGGNISIYGKPRVINEKKIAGGKITKINK
ncbi:DUF2807 domain-containing protein [Flavobacterium agricola]|uniref:DUF2807 domain-containing protein n=1 Tax=Flavobacterium agricola TaxID=2870839 RepID=A0ABY6LX60_9FLAO|nr:head GIN domain-containing protein [Flavobacterium agricola]UYW00919.1 DUF2807 domain-containing protein [Flavobacterium agricola]